jgi:hypothetical protein
MNDKNYTVELAILVYVGLFFLVSLILMWSWNYFMPMLFSLPAISFWQACGIRILSMCLFGQTNVNANKK